MANVTLYTRTYCPYSRRAKEILRTKGIEFHEIDIERDPSREAEMIERAAGRDTVPEIFIEGHHIGGCDELEMLEAEGQLDAMLEGGAATPP